MSCDYIVPKNGPSVTLFVSQENATVTNYDVSATFINGPASATSLGAITGSLSLVGGIANLTLNAINVIGTGTDQFAGSVLTGMPDSLVCGLPGAFWLTDLAPHNGLNNKGIIQLTQDKKLKFFYSPSGDFLADAVIHMLRYSQLQYVTAAEIERITAAV